MLQRSELVQQAVNEITQALKRQQQDSYLVSLDRKSDVVVVPNVTIMPPCPTMQPLHHSAPQCNHIATTPHNEWQLPRYGDCFQLNKTALVMSSADYKTQSLLPTWVGHHGFTEFLILLVGEITHILTKCLNPKYVVLSPSSRWGRDRVCLL